MEEISEGPVIISGRLEPDMNGGTETVQEIGKGAKFLGGVGHTKFLAALPSGRFDEGFVTILGDIDGYPDNRFRRTLRTGHGRSVSLCECSAHSQYRRPSADHDPTSRASGRYAPFSPACLLRSGKKPAPLPRCYGIELLIFKELAGAQFLETIVNIGLVLNIGRFGGNE